jgi:hypothetical protein
MWELLKLAKSMGVDEHPRMPVSAAERKFVCHRSKK